MKDEMFSNLHMLLNLEIKRRHEFPKSSILINNNGDVKLKSKYGLEATYRFALKPGMSIRVKFHDMYGLESAVPTLKDILGSKMAEDKYCDAIVLTNTDGGSRITLVTCNTREDICVTFALDINDINNGKIELIELIPKEVEEHDSESTKNDKKAVLSACEAMGMEVD